MRIYELARQQAKTSKEIIEVCQSLGIMNKVAQSAVKGEDLVTIMNYFESGKDCTSSVIPVEEATTPTIMITSPSQVVYVSTECLPFLEIGELGTQAKIKVEQLKADNQNVVVFLPYAKQVNECVKPTHVLDVCVHINGVEKVASLYRAQLEDVSYYFIKQDEYFNREQLYGYEDDVYRFSFYCHAILTALPYVVVEPHFELHVNDWHTSFIPLLLHTMYQTDYYQSIKTTLTVHSLEYQGWFEPSVLEPAIGISNEYYQNGLTRMGSSVNILKSGIETAHNVTLSNHSKQQIELTEMIECGISGVLYEKLSS